MALTTTESPGYPPNREEFLYEADNMSPAYLLRYESENTPSRAELAAVSQPEKYADRLTMRVKRAALPIARIAIEAMAYANEQNDEEAIYWGDRVETHGGLTIPWPKMKTLRTLTLEQLELQEVAKKEGRLGKSKDDFSELGISFTKHGELWRALSIDELPQLFMLGNTISAIGAARPISNCDFDRESMLDALDELSLQPEVFKRYYSTAVKGLVTPATAEGVRILDSAPDCLVYARSLVEWVDSGKKAGTVRDLGVVARTAYHVAKGTNAQ